ncbi:MAG: tRNA modification GTPase MnmE [Chlamydiia bacterium]|nr:tRNA modification GTPase MnmE [Chlamydiia bacterium]
MNDVIIAQATPPGIGALSIIRLSGKGCLDLTNSFFSKDVLTLKPHKATLGNILSSNHSIIDEVILITMKGQKSFTGEDSVEIICHGSPLIVKKILTRALELGARLAEGGEFSRRAYSNGKIDLLQAEAIKEIIHAKNERALKEASKQLAGSLSVYIKDLQQCFIDLLTIIEVHIDYPEEGLEEATKAEVISMIQITREKILKLLNSFTDGKKLFNGHKIAIIGAPNAGKSSLLNALLEEDRAIVTEIAGTTRDTIEEEILIDNHTFKFIDTAGIHNSQNKVEQIGIEKTLKTIHESDITILLIDLSTPINDQIIHIYKSLINPIIAYNKQDICKLSNPLNIQNPIYISAKEKQGLQSLKNAILEKTHFEHIDDTPLITKERHHHCLKESLSSLDKTLTGIEADLSIDLISFDLRFGLEKLSEVIGINITEEILGGIFSKFCVGK